MSPEPNVAKAEDYFERALAIAQMQKHNFATVLGAVALGGWWRLWVGAATQIWKSKWKAFFMASAMALGLKSGILDH